MRELPILFSGPMVQSLLNTKPNTWPAEPIDAGKPFKCQTRRTIKDKDIINSFDIDVDGSVIAYIDQATGDSYPPTVKARYQPGDRLWVRETWADVNTADGPAFTYRADQELKFCSDDAWPVEYERYPNCTFAMWCSDLWNNAPEHKWRPSIFMPKAAARIWLEVVNTRSEKLQEITEEDAMAEGISALEIEGIGRRYFVPGTDLVGHRARYAFVGLWDSLNAKRGFPFESNPYVWVYELKRVDGDA